MKAIMVMFDSLNRHMLPSYGCDWVQAPNFQRLAQRTVQFNRSYVCSMPCMPARRDLHTGRPNFLHRSWGPLEPFDNSVPEMLRKNGVYTHLASDHYHYWEDGGATYHGRYSTWEFFRGQEGDPWRGQLADPQLPENLHPRQAGNDRSTRQDWINRAVMPQESDMPQAQTMSAGLDFIRRNHTADNWFLQIETFDPHEPYFSLEKHKKTYADHYKNYKGRNWDWPMYAPSTGQAPEEVEHLRYECASLVAMCDSQLGKIIDMMDELDLWKDTMLIVWTDHGFLLGEHECLGKVWAPFYEEVAHTPFFVWDPRAPTAAGTQREALVQPSIDLGPTLLDYFGLPLAPGMLGKPLRDAIASDTPVREAGMFGAHGGVVNVTDGRYVYMRAAATPAENQPLFNYTLMTTLHQGMYPVEGLQNIQLHPPFTFTKGCSLMQIPVRTVFRHPDTQRNMLFDVLEDPKQEHPLDNPEIESRMSGLLWQLMKECDAPVEQYQRIGFEMPEK